jgi:hypothetical protein
MVNGNNQFIFLSKCKLWLNYTSKEMKMMYGEVKSMKIFLTKLKILKNEQTKDSK